MQGRRGVVGGLGAAVIVVFALAGCTGSDDPEAPATSAQATQAIVEPTPTPTVDPAEAARQADIDAATGVYERYVQTTDEIAQGGYTQPEAIDVYIGDADELDFVRHDFEDSAALGITQAGSRKVLSTEVVEYIGDPLDDSAVQQIRLNVCLDVSETTLFDTAGVNHKIEGLPGSIHTIVLMQGFPDDPTTAKWKIMTQEPILEECA